MHKLITTLIEAHHPDNKVAIEQDGVLTELKGVRRVVIDSGDAQVGDSPTGEITIWAGVLKAEITISDQTAEAALRLLSDRTLSFIKTTEAYDFVAWCKENGIAELATEGVHKSKVLSPQAAIVIAKLAAELVRREEIPF